MRRVKGLFIHSVLLLYALSAFALPDDAHEMIHIAADASEFNYKTGVNTYEGNVKVTQGTSQLLADKVVTQNAANHKIEIATAYGYKQRAKYTTIPKKGDLLFEALANVIKFYPPQSKIELEGDVFVKQGENSFNGPHIVYNIDHQIVTVPASGGRATITLKP